MIRRWGSARLTRARRRWFAVCSLAVLVVTGTACSTQGAALEQPVGVEHLRPAMFAYEKAPVTVSWVATGSLAPGQRYMVFVDQLPMQPGESVRELTDDACRQTPGCPDEAELNRRAIYMTRTTQVKIPAFPIDGPYPVEDLVDMHEITLVIVDRDLVRVGEDYWTTSFTVERTL